MASSGWEVVNDLWTHWVSLPLFTVEFTVIKAFLGTTKPPLEASPFLSASLRPISAADRWRSSLCWMCGVIPSSNCPEAIHPAGEVLCEWGEWSSAEFRRWCAAEGDQLNEPVLTFRHRSPQTCDGHLWDVSHSLFSWILTRLKTFVERRSCKGGISYVGYELEEDQLLPRFSQNSGKSNLTKQLYCGTTTALSSYSGAWGEGPFHQPPREVRWPCCAAKALSISARSGATSSRDVWIRAPSLQALVEVKNLICWQHARCWWSRSGRGRLVIPIRWWISLDYL